MRAVWTTFHGAIDKQVPLIAKRCNGEVGLRFELAPGALLLALGEQMLSRFEPRRDTHVRKE